MLLRVCPLSFLIVVKTESQSFNFLSTFDLADVEVLL